MGNSKDTLEYLSFYTFGIQKETHQQWSIYPTVQILIVGIPSSKEVPEPYDQTQPSFFNFSTVWRVGQFMTQKKGREGKGTKCYFKVG